MTGQIIHHERVDRSGILRQEQRPGRTVLIAAAVVVMITVLGFLLRSHPVDASLTTWLNSAHVGVIAAISNGVYAAFSPAPAIVITIVITALVWLRSRRLQAAAAFAGTVAITWIPSDVIKLLVDRPRPDVATLSHPFTPAQVDPSFPSGHAAFVTALVVALLFLAGNNAHRRAVLAGGVLLVALVAIALSIDAVHYPTDVLASIAWSAAVAPAARFLAANVILPRVPGLRPLKD
ncbi:phosphatase PAP2 family protein [Curtobacterium sp. UNCCL17]|uniref:phosphatase PAP2 family protein n=1 Tax=Curtobacterium sp. UNCCL17 TaxID=1449051 RepID=UPI0012DC92D8|nr:phosphatase PAP2 family protein [Curtobacterium sp. UNCCL17]